METYNPDKAPDPFTFLKTIPTKDIVQEDEINAIDKQGGSSIQIVTKLRSKNFIAPSTLKLLAVHKEVVLEYIKASPIELKRELIIESLDNSSNLGAFFRVQRGLFTPTLDRGSLKQIEKINRMIN